jgi:hypothetical protein
MDRMIELAELPVKLVFEDAGFDKSFKLPEGESAGEPVMEIRVETAGGIRAAQGLEVSCARGGLIEFSMHGVECRLDTQAGRGRLLIAPDISALEYALKMIYSVLLIGRGGGIFHAACLEWAGGGYMFAGPHGAGKSTIAGCAPGGAIILGDENVAVRRREGGDYMIYSLPRWAVGGGGGAVIPAAPLKAPLAACFVISHGRETEFEHSTPAGRVRLLFENLIYLPPEKDILETALKFVEELQRGVVTAGLRLALDDMEDLKDAVFGYLGKEI